ncbi:hypothetical protein [Thermocrinis jamiesonii]|uniref:hypothetical protein n=1 Tax=Thermocrinis jamiesonii TaxID=1302351 RepID=UPI0004962398|nr:hypothetical protein [Thermocrinis jamiesonii]
MRNLVSFVLMLLGFILFGWGIYTSFEIYATKKQEKISTNFASFVLSVFKGEELKRLDYPEQGFFILKPSEGKVFTVGGVLQKPIDPNAYLSYSKKDLYNNEVFVYIKKYNLGEFVEELIRNPISLGISLSGIILFLTGVLYMLIQKPVYVAKQGRKEHQSSLENKLKALRLVLATHKIIPQESSEEAKKILDDILKEMEAQK